jgi:glycosyltransferase involved in cell wall biosynthesis
MVRVLLVLSQRPEATGSGIYVRALLEEARRRGHEAFLVAGVPVGWEIPSLPVPRDRCRFVTFGTLGDLPFPVPGMSDVMPYASTRFRDLTANQIDAYEEAFSVVCRDVVSRFEPRVIHAQHLWLVTSRLCKDIPELPLLASCHGSDLRQFLQLSHLRARVRAGCSRLDAVAALTTEQAEEIATLFEIPRGRIAVTGAGFDPRLFSPGKTRCGTVRIVYAGKLSRAKGVPWMLRALFRLRDLPWELHLVGSGGSEEAECRALAHPLGDRIVLHGALSQEALASLFRSSTLFVLPSLFEGLPLVLLEALASGCCAVATDLPGVRDVAASVGDDALTLVSLPERTSVDQFPPEGEMLFVDALENSLEAMLRRCLLGDIPSPEEVARRVEGRTWENVFSGIELLLAELCRRRRGQ